MREGSAYRKGMGDGRRRSGAALSVTGVLLAGAAWGQAGPVRLDGVPEQIIPRVLDVGLGSFEIVPGTGVVVGGTPAPGGGGGGEGVPAGASTALDVMSGRSWGEAATQNALAVGVNPSALAATCMVESGCQNVAAREGSRIRGAFQMYDPTFEAGLTQAVAYNPALQGTIQRGVDGSMDPANQSISAAATLRNLAESLQRAGIANPTVLDVRGGFNFGAGYAAAIAQADDSQLMAGLMPAYTAQQLAANGIAATTTVGEWRQAVAARMGDAAYQPVLVSQ